MTDPTPSADLDKIETILAELGPLVASAGASEDEDEYYVTIQTRFLDAASDPDFQGELDKTRARAESAIQVLLAVPGIIAELRTRRAERVALLEKAIKGAGYLSLEEYEQRETLYLIQDIRPSPSAHRVWWRHAGAGYTWDLREAGRFPLIQVPRGRPTDVPVKLADALSGATLVAGWTR